MPDYSPSKIYKFKIIIPEIEVEATSQSDALEKAKDRLDQLSGSNDGSELLANADLEDAGLYVCRHDQTKTSSYKGSTYEVGQNSRWVDVRTTFTYCKICKKTLHKEEVVLGTRS